MDYRQPIPVRGGIRAGSKRGGAFGTCWWSQRWLSIIASYNLPSRLQAGRRYARNGQVIDLTITKGAIYARVQGSREKPYDVSIHCATLNADQWRTVGKALAKRPDIAAALAAKRIPLDIETIF